jgi:osmotically-inducible protein OsmY
MNNLRILAILSLLLSFVLAQGCSTIWSSTRTEPIEESDADRTIGTLIEDEVIENKALVNIDKADPELAQSHIVATSYNGILLIAGQVRTEELRQTAANTAAKIKKVRRVHNELTVSGKTSMVIRSNDSWITTKIKSKMLSNSTIEGNRIKVVTENGVVYLMGLITKEEADRAAELARKTTGVQKVVRIFEYI